MKKDKFNQTFREYARTLSPQQNEKDFISKIYQSFNDLLGVNNCLQIGSYPRFTAITPVNDLDILYILGDWDENSHNPPSTALQNLNTQINNNYKNPTSYSIKVSLQTHSVTISYLDNDEDIFSVDIIPAYIFSKNEFNDDVYKVPEIVRKKHGKNRIEYYQSLLQAHREMDWIASDPRGYIKIAAVIDQLTDGEFRKTAKIIKKWKNNLVYTDNNLKLKSFHLEQVITRFFQENQRLEIFDAIFKFFADLPKIVNNPNQINDRANNGKFIDDYLVDFTGEQKGKMKLARDYFLVKLENLKESSSIDRLLEIDFYQRKSPEEAFLFDSRIKTFIDGELKFKIDGFVRPIKGFSAGWLTQTPQLQNGLTQGEGKIRKIEFSIRMNNTAASEYRWKVKNSDECKQPRGEITLNQTKNNPEATEHIGNHYVECYAIKSGVCIARSKVPVKII